jgi:hypothetical protein
MLKSMTKILKKVSKKCRHLVDGGITRAFRPMASVRIELLQLQVYYNIYDILLQV